MAKLIIATDIHGLSPELNELFSPLLATELGYEVALISPWFDEKRPEGTEAEWVTHFLAKDGVTRYASHIAACASGDAAVIIGFSVGATAAWHYVAQAACHPQSRAYLFYGSRIRDAVDLDVRCRTHLLFAEHEASFDPHQLIERFVSPQVEAEVLTGLYHGFMNPLHQHFDRQRADLEIARIAQDIRSMRC